MSKSKRIELDVRGMHCESCAAHVSRALARVPGVEHVEVPGWSANWAAVTATLDVNEAELTASVERAGYGAAVKSIATAVAAVEKPQRGRNGGPSNGSDFDLLVIGAGSAGFAAAIKGAELGFRVGLVGQGAVGGTCVNVGCVPSKTLIRAAAAWHSAAHHPFEGVGTRQTALDWSAVRAAKDALVAEMRKSRYEDVLSAYPGIEYLEGQATFVNGGGILAGNDYYTANRYVITSGAHPRKIEFPGTAEVEPLTSTTLMELEELPRSLIILGGRAVALELGQLMARFGVDVLILQRNPRLIPDHEPEVSRAVKDYLEREGIAVVTGVQVEKLSRSGGQRTVRARVSGREQEFSADQILMAVGREANTKGMGLEVAGVQTDPDGRIKVDATMRTSNAAIYASGDVTSNPEFVYVAAAGGSLAAQNALAETAKPLDLSAMPSVIFTDPQIATVGLTESRAREKGYDVMTSVIGLEYVARAQAARDTRGLIKLVADKASRRLLGAHMLAAEAGEAIQTAATAIKFGATLDDLKDLLFPYLTHVEGIKLAALAFEKDLSKLSCCAA